METEIVKVPKKELILSFDGTSKHYDVTGVTAMNFGDENKVIAYMNNKFQAQDLAFYEPSRYCGGINLHCSGHYRYMVEIWLPTSVDVKLVNIETNEVEPLYI